MEIMAIIYRQLKLSEKSIKDENKPTVTVFRNYYSAPMGIIKEEVIKKVWLIKTMKA